MSSVDADTIRGLVQMVVATATAPIRTMAVAETLRGDGIHQSDIYRALAILECRHVIERRRDLMGTAGRAEVVWQIAPIDLDQLQEV